MIAAAGLCRVVGEFARDIHAANFAIRAERRTAENQKIRFATRRERPDARFDAENFGGNSRDRRERLIRRHAAAHSESADHAQIGKAVAFGTRERDLHTAALGSRKPSGNANLRIERFGVGADRRIRAAIALFEPQHDRQIRPGDRVGELIAFDRAADVRFLLVALRELNRVFDIRGAAGLDAQRQIAAPSLAEGPLVILEISAKTRRGTRRARNQFFDLEHLPEPRFRPLPLRRHNRLVGGCEERRLD